MLLVCCVVVILFNKVKLLMLEFEIQIRNLYKHAFLTSL
jgi:hypothetical protein